MLLNKMSLYFFSAALLSACGAPGDRQNTAEDDAQVADVSLRVLDVVTLSEATEFAFTGTEGALQHGVAVGLRDNFKGSFLKYEDRTGVNLGWTSTDTRNFKVLRAAGVGQVRYGDVVAIGVRDGSAFEYLLYAHQDFGINITSRRNVPQYNWKLEGGTPGVAVRVGEPVRLLNLTNGNHPVYCKRPVGINLAWRTDCHKVPTQGRVYVP